MHVPFIYTAFVEKEDIKSAKDLLIPGNDPETVPLDMDIEEAYEALQRFGADYIDDLQQDVEGMALSIMPQGEGCTVSEYQPGVALVEYSREYAQAQSTQRAQVMAELNTLTQKALEQGIIYNPLNRSPLYMKSMANFWETEGKDLFALTQKVWELIGYESCAHAIFQNSTYFGKRVLPVSGLVSQILELFGNDPELEKVQYVVSTRYTSSYHC